MIDIGLRVIDNDYIPQHVYDLLINEVARRLWWYPVEAVELVSYCTHCKDPEPREDLFLRLSGMVGDEKYYSMMAIPDHEIVEQVKPWSNTNTVKRYAKDLAYGILDARENHMREKLE